MTLRDKVAASIGAFTSVGARLLAPAMPWIYLCLRRALIPTACWVILAISFFLVPQSREVLHGLSEAPLNSIYDFAGELSALVNVSALLSYATTGVVLALALWYCARLLSTVESGNATPVVLAAGEGMGRLKLATTWLPRILGVSALGAAMGALIYANITPQLTQVKALLVVLASVAGPVLLSPAWLIDRPIEPLRRWALIVVGCSLLLAGDLVIVRQAEKWRVWAWCLGCSVLPAIMIVFLLKRRSLLERLGMNTEGMSGSGRQFGEVVVTVVSMLLLSLGALLLLALSPSIIVRGFGSAASVLLFLTSAALFLTAMQLILRRLSRDVPGLTTAAILLVAVLVAAFGQESVGTEELVASDAAAPIATLEAKFQGSQPAARGVFVNAYGGGLRAAVFTAEVLAQADDATCGQFGESVVALSGVSGGSLGIATYLVARQAFKARGGWIDCGKDPSTATPLTDLVTRALVQDHLSTPIARMLAVDAPHIPGSPTRGQALLDSWQSALVEALEVPEVDSKKVMGFALPLGKLTGGTQYPIRVYFSATDADSGHIVAFSNQSNGTVWDNARGRTGSVERMSVGQAVLHSARFPIVSPAGSFDFPSASDKLRLVDGGYADNSGATTLLRAFSDPAVAAIPKDVQVLLDIDGNPPDESSCITTHGRPPILTAVRGLLQARSAHAKLAVDQFEQQLGKVGLHIQLSLEPVFNVPATGDASNSAECEKVRRSQQAPLGWYVSYGAAKAIAKSAEFGVNSITTALRLSRPQPMPAVVPEK